MRQDSGPASLKYDDSRESPFIEDRSLGFQMSHRDVGIVGYGVYIPWERIETEKIVRERERKRGKELERVLEKVRHGLLLREKALAGHTEGGSH